MPNENLLQKYQRTGKNFSTNLDYLLKNKEFDFSAVFPNSYEKKRISQRALAKILGVSPTSVNEWCNNGSARPAPDALYVIAEGFHVSIEYLLDDHNNVFDIVGTQTYWSIFNTIKSLSKIAEIRIEHDPFLIYLVEESKKIDSMSALSNSDKALWYNKLENDFSKRYLQDTFFIEMVYDSMLKMHTPPIPECSLQYEPVGYDEFLSIFNAVQSYFEQGHYEDYDFKSFKEWCDAEGIYCNDTNFQTYYDLE